MCYLKAKYPEKVFEETWFHLFKCMWVDHINVTILTSLAECLKATGHFSASETESIVNSTGEKEWKDKLSANTQQVLEQGAFGAPWFWVKNSEWKEEPFFGSDRQVLLI